MTRRTERPDYDEWVRLADAYTLPEIAEMRGVGYHTVYGWQKHYGYKARNGNLARLERERANPELPSALARTHREAIPEKPTAGEWAALCQKHTSAELRALFKRSYWTIWSWGQEFGVSPLTPSREKPAEVRRGYAEIPTRLLYWNQPNHRLDLEG